MAMVPGFILKLWKMVNDPSCGNFISWSQNGQSFIITDAPHFSQELSKYFKHNNLSSFIRQLNMYGFRKVTSLENNEELHFYHPDFIKDHPERLEAIKRKLPQRISENADLKTVYKGITEIEERQKDVAETLNELKKENQMLWSEIQELREKHQQQQLYIKRLMKLVFEAMEQNGIQTHISLKRNSPLMIEGITPPDTDESNVVPNVLNTPVVEPNTTPFQVESQIDSADYQIDTLVPSITDYSGEEINNFFE